MKTARHSIAAALLLAGAAAGLGCSSQTSMTQLWSAPMPSSVAPMHKIVVIALRMDPANRVTMEDQLGHALEEHGVEAVLSYRLFPQGLPDREAAKSVVEKLGADGILTATLKSVRERVSYVPGYYGTEANGGLWGGYYGWGTYVSADEIVNLETTLWDARAADTVVWSALTATTDPTNGRSLVSGVTEKVVPALAAGHFIPPKIER